MLPMSSSQVFSLRYPFLIHLLLFLPVFLLILFICLLPLTANPCPCPTPACLSLSSSSFSKPFYDLFQLIFPVFFISKIFPVFSFCISSLSASSRSSSLPPPS